MAPASRSSVPWHYTRAPAYTLRARTCAPSTQNIAFTSKEGEARTNALDCMCRATLKGAAL
eukprot:5509236-Alexandrium_andersonii.AAC.1